jgi:uncharacterized protein (TIGR00251 family)
MTSKDSPADLKIIRRQNAIVFYVKVIPASSRTSFENIRNGMLRIKVSAAPERGKANQALISFLADKLKVKKKFITIISGLRSKIKQIAVEQLSPEILIERLEPVL